MWTMAILLNFAFGSLTQIAIKSTVHRLPNAKALSFLFLICALVMVGYNVVLDRVAFSQSLLLISAVGFVNAFGAYFQWKAYRYSLSKSALCFPLIGIITVILAAILLGESRIYSGWIIAGSSLLFLSLFLLKKQGGEKEEETGGKWILFVLGMVLISGIAVFIMKYSASDIARSALPVLGMFPTNVPIEAFLLYWYCGAFIGTLPILSLERNNTAKLFVKSIWRVPFVSIGSLGALASMYWALSFAPAGAVVPIQSFGSTFLPVLFGWFLFKEIRGIKKIQMLGFVLGIMGSSLIILNI